MSDEGDDLTLDLFAEPEATQPLPLEAPEEAGAPEGAAADAGFALFGRDLFGEPIQAAQAGGKLNELFLVPPFSVLDTRQGYWQERKRAWLALGIKSELGRGDCMPSGAHSCYSGSSDWSGARGPARSFNEDLMRKERDYTNAKGELESASLKNGLTFSTSFHPFRPPKTPGGNLLGFSASCAIKRNGEGYDGADMFVQPAESRAQVEANGTSIFDPVLCELAYRWFCPEGGRILDPFCGGSVRGIVAAKLGHAYTGVDLLPEQVAANAAQWDALAGPVRVKVSAASARLAFHGCEPGYIREVCHARCCESAAAESGTLITIHPREQAAIIARGGVVSGGLLVTPDRKCTFKTPEDLCGLHLTPDKPFGCIASPFTLNDHGTLIVRNRYKLLKCYGDGVPVPAYKAFRASLDTIFGLPEAARVCAHLDADGGDIEASMPAISYRILRENDDVKHGRRSAAGPAWIAGDSRDLPLLAGGEYDFLFSCPPYGDLERYSEDPRDLSTLPYPEFREAYRGIIAAAANLLKPDRFAAFVVSEIRDPAGIYRGFYQDTIEAFKHAGLKFYNDAAIINAAGSLPLRVQRQFRASRKLGRSHQYFAVFVKGNPKVAADLCRRAEEGSNTAAQ